MFLALPYSRSFTIGRTSEQLLNEELHKMYESIRHLTDTPPAGELPTAKLDGSAWHRRSDNTLRWWDATKRTWRKYFENEFRITDQIMATLPPDDPVKGQLWIHNEVLCYYNGVEWKPLKALLQDGSQFSLDVFKNFILISPLWKIGNTVIRDEDIEAYKEERRKYLQGVLDANTDSTVTGDGSKYKVNEHNCIQSVPTIPVLPEDAMVQLLVPNIDYARIFLDHVLDTSKYSEASKVCIEYKKNDLIDTTPSLIHINPGRLTKITKRLILIDRQNPRINIPAGNTEYYGFHENDPLGDLLLPDEDDQHLSDYTIIEDGILLSYNACQNYDYVLAITYEFSWMKSTGRLAHVNAADSSHAYYIDNYVGPTNVFVQGYDLEDPYFEENGIDQTVTIKEDIGDMEVAMMHSPVREYGYIRMIDINNNAIIHPLRDYKKPLLFINGQAMHPTLDGVKWNSDGTVSVPGAKQDMMWSIIELKGAQLIGGGKYEEYEAAMESGVVDAAGHIPYKKATVPDVGYKNAVLFIDGLIVKKEDITIDRDNCIITVDGGLTPGQEYILIEDKYNWLYDEKSLAPALPVGKFTDSLVYMNGHILCNDTAIDTLQPAYTQKQNPDGTMSNVAYPGVYNEIKCFKTVTLGSDKKTEIVTRDYRKYNSKKEIWEPYNDTATINKLKAFAYGYENMPKSVHLLINYTQDDDIQIYAYNTANALEHPLVIGNIDADTQHPILTVGNGKYWDAAQNKEVPFSDPNRNKLATPFIYGKNTLRVWCNGIRQYPYTEKKCDGILEYLKNNNEVDGSGNAFRLPEPFTGKITYAVEMPENNMDKPCTMEVLNHTNILPNYVNMYKTEQPLFPGRVTVYVNGIRLPENAYTLFDNHTLLINDDKALIGNNKNYPTEIIAANNTTHTLNRPQDDLILVEVRQDERVEKTITCKGHPVYDIDTSAYNLDPSILEASDEIMIFVNGLFFGPSLNNGYAKSITRGVISISQDDTLQVMNYDEEKIHLDGDQESLEKYRINHNNNDYVQDNAKLTLEWR